MWTFPYKWVHTSFYSLSLYLSSLSLSPSHLRMATWILVEINFSKVIGTSQDFPIVWSTDIVHVSAICTFWPDSWKVQIHDPYSSVIKWRHFFMHWFKPLQSIQHFILSSNESKIFIMLSQYSSMISTYSKSLPAALNVRVQFPVAHSKSLTAEIDVSCLHAGIFPEIIVPSTNLKMSVLPISTFLANRLNEREREREKERTYSRELRSLLSYCTSILHPWTSPGVLQSCYAPV